MSVPMTSSDLERRTEELSFLSGGSSYIRSYRLTNRDQIGMVTHFGEERVYNGSGKPPVPKRGTPALPVFRAPFLMPISFDVE